MANDPKFMAGRWKQRLANNEREFKKKSWELSKEEREKKLKMLRAQAQMVKKYEKMSQASYVRPGALNPEEYPRGEYSK